MMRIASALAVCAAALLALPSSGAVGVQFRLNFSTSTAATYADGTAVRDGEWFMLVWTAPGVTIDLSKDVTGDVNSFFRKDGDGKIVMNCMRKKAAKNGLCGSVNFSATNELYKTGHVQLYLLDTRISATELAPLGENDNGYEVPTFVRAAAPVKEVSYDCSKLWGTSPTTAKGTAPALADWTVIPIVPKPVLTAFSVANAFASVGATNTVAAKSYVLVKAFDVGFTNVLWTSAAKQGLSDPNAALSFDDANATNSAAFYRIEVKQ